MGRSRFKEASLESLGWGEGAFFGRRGNEGGRCQTVTGIKICAAEARGSKRCSKTFQSLCTDWLCAVGDDFPGAEVKGSLLLRRNFTYAEIVSKIWSTTISCSFTRNGL